MYDHGTDHGLRRKWWHKLKFTILFCSIFLTFTSLMLIKHNFLSCGSTHQEGHDKRNVFFRMDFFFLISKHVPTWLKTLTYNSVTPLRNTTRWFLGYMTVNWEPRCWVTALVYLAVCSSGCQICAPNFLLPPRDLQLSDCIELPLIDLSLWMWHLPSSWKHLLSTFCFTDLKYIKKKINKIL